MQPARRIERQFHLFAAALLLVAAGVSGSAAAEARSIPAPGRSIAGLAFDGKHLWCADRATRTIFQVDAATGKVLKQFPTPGQHAAELEWDDGCLWHVDGRTRKVYRIDAKEGKVASEFPAPGGDPPGIVRLRDALLVSDWNDSVVYTVDARDGKVRKTQWSPLAHPWGMATDGRLVWFANGDGGEVVAVDVDRWQTVTAVPVPTSQPTGIALDGDGLWVAGMGEDRLWRVEIGGGKARHVVRREVLRQVRVVTEINRGPAPLKKIACCLVLPVDKPGQRIAGPIRFRPEPLKVDVDERGQRVARFEAANIPVGGFLQAAWCAEIEFEVLRWTVFPGQAGRAPDAPAAIRDVYTRKAKRYDMDHPAVLLAAREAVGDEKDLFWQTRAIHDFCIRRFRYISPGWRPAAEGLRLGTGICDDYANLLVSLCRLNGIPARVMIGSNHVSAEVYFPGIGAWFPIDPTADDKPDLALWQRAFAFGLSDRIITHIEDDADPGFWKPKYESDDPRTQVDQEVGERFVPKQEPPGPVFSGIFNVQDQGTGKPLVLEWDPAYDPDGRLPIRYEVCLVPSAAAVGSVRPALTTEATRCELKDLQPGATYWVRVVPVNSEGRRFPAALSAPEHVREVRNQ